MAHEYVSKGIPFLRSLNIRRNSVDPTDLKFISAEFHAKLQKSRLSPGDVVSVQTGKPGVTAVVPSVYDTANCADLIVFTSGLNIAPIFLSELLNNLLGDIEDIRGSTGAIQTHFNIERAKELRIPLPPLALQRRFVTIVEQHRGLRARHLEALRQAEHLFQTLLHQAFTPQ
jgi:type I restriction enzyme S subunit